MSGSKTLECLLYVGKLKSRLCATDLRHTMGVAQIANRRGDVTGALAFSDECVAEVLEGAADDLRQALERVVGSGLHRQIKVLRRDPVGQREFGDWTSYPIHRIDMLRLVEGLLEPAVAAEPQVEQLARLLRSEREVDSRY